MLSLKGYQIIINRPENPLLIKELLKQKNKNIQFLKKDIKIFLEDIENKIINFDKGINFLGDVIKNKKKIGIIGDYDADGTIATSIIVNFLKHINYPHCYYIPNRFKDGYGPSQTIIEEMYNKEVEVIIMVDTGTKANIEVALAENLGMKVVILDHHLPSEDLPNASILINPHINGHFNYFCGAGLTFIFFSKLQKFLIKNNILNKDNIFLFNDLLDLVAVATVCDFVPLKDLNRSLVYYGLEKIKKNPYIAFKIIYENNPSNNINDASDLGFYIGPYLNVAGRIEDANMVVEFLTTKDIKKLNYYFNRIKIMTAERKYLQNKMIQKIEMNIQNTNDIFIANEEFHEGIIGIVASQMKQKYNRTSCVISIKDNICKGSMRTNDNFSATDFIEMALKENLLIKGGGHARAGGFSLKKKNLDLLENYFYKYGNNFINSIQNIFVSSILDFTNINEKIYKEIHQIGPFGIENEEFVFLFPFLRINNFFLLQNKHISFYLKHFYKSKSIKALYFNFPMKLIYKIQKNNIIHLIGNIKYNKYFYINIIDIVVTNIN
ncbi:hypothetical protein AB836_00760 [Rickettsiales bacterium (ex Bugula neritina AB1)]|nr:hypothetical protein AB836_00760 [Rickettsiales bacterium (ex Bugula neritina AB1)]